MAASLRKHFILAAIIGLILVLLLLRHCVWKAAPVAHAPLSVAPAQDDAAARAAAIQQILDAPSPVVVFHPPPAPPPSPEPVYEPAPQKTPPAKPKPVRRQAPRATANSTATPTPRPLAPATYVPKPDIEPGAYYVVRQKVEQSGKYYVVCTIMGDSTNRRFGYAISAEQYAKADRGLVYDSKNMIGWQRVNRIE